MGGIQAYFPEDTRPAQASAVPLKWDNAFCHRGALKIFSDICEALRFPSDSCFRRAGKEMIISISCSLVLSQSSPGPLHGELAEEACRTAACQRESYAPSEAGVKCGKHRM